MRNTKFWRTALVATLVLTVMLSVTGGTIAWFTDAVESSSNVISAGNLDVELYYMDQAMTEWAKVDKNTNVFKTSTLWEPGHTEVVKLKVVNEGSLALQYQLTANVASETASTNVNGEAFELSDYVKFGVVDGVQAYTRDEAVAAVEANAVALSSGYDVKNVALLPGAAKEVTMVVYMPTTVGNEANHAKGADVPAINLGVKLLAYQKDHEEDAFGSDYDVILNVSNNAELKSLISGLAAMEEDEIYVNANGADVGMLNSTAIVPAGKTLTIANAWFGPGSSKDNKVNGTLIFENCTFDSDLYTMNTNGGNGKLVFNNCQIKGWASFNGPEVEMNNCRIEGNGTYGLVRCYTNATITNCTFDLSATNKSDNYADRIDCGSANPTNTITLINCTNVNGAMEDICDSAAMNKGKIVIK